MGVSLECLNSHAVCNVVCLMLISSDGKQHGEIFAFPLPKKEGKKVINFYVHKVQIEMYLGGVSIEGDIKDILFFS